MVFQTAQRGKSVQFESTNKKIKNRQRNSKIINDRGGC